MANHPNRQKPKWVVKFNGAHCAVTPIDPEDLTWGVVTSKMRLSDRSLVGRVVAVAECYLSEIGGYAMKEVYLSQTADPSLFKDAVFVPL